MPQKGFVLSGIWEMFALVDSYFTRGLGAPFSGGQGLRLRGGCTL
jgi:hypothetical protein